MDYRIRPARRSEAKPLIGLYSESGCGKTCSALLLAKGFAGDMSKVCMIETESGRGEAFADDPDIGGYQVISMRDEFSPKNYGCAIDEANKAGFVALIIDSASHEWEGTGGVLGMAARNEEAGKKGVLIWQQPKMDHQREFMLRLMQTPIPLVIVCMRAKHPMKQVVKNGKKEWERSEFLEPKQSEDILFEMMVHAWIDAEHCLRITKPKPAEKYGVVMRGIFEEGKPISVETGQRLAEWSRGSIKPDKTQADKNRARLEIMVQEAKIDRDKFKSWLVFVKWLPDPGYESPSMKDLPDAKIAELITEPKWKQAMGLYSKWLREATA